jgi:hypothetical protein
VKAARCSSPGTGSKNGPALGLSVSLPINPVDNDSFLSFAMTGGRVHTSVSGCPCNPAHLICEMMQQAALYSKLGLSLKVTSS